MTCPQAEPDYAELQHQVQRWLGRCLLSLQQSERLLKALLQESNITVSTSVSAMKQGLSPEVRRAYEKERVTNMTLGGLVSALCVDLAKGKNTDADGVSERELPNEFTLQMRFGVQLEPSIALAMREMVVLRNDLVHHLIERFDLQEFTGCALALAHLEASYDKAEAFRVQLRRVAGAMAQGREDFAALLRTSDAKDMLFTGRVPLSAGAILEALDQAIKACPRAQDGTVLLQDMIAEMQKRFPEETPNRYGRTSWLQLIHESRRYQIIRTSSDGTRSAPRVRVKAEQALSAAPSPAAAPTQQTPAPPCG